MSTIAGIEIQNTKNLINPNTKYCCLVYSPPKFGKTSFAASLDEFTRKTCGKPSLVIAVEQGEGGGTMSVRELGLDYVVPQDMKSIGAIIAALYTDTKYGGVILDSSTEYVNRFLKPYALAMPNPREKSPTRSMGVPGQSDYQTMGEAARIDFNRLVNLTNHPDLNIRKHLVVTALEREKTDRDTQAVTSIQPDLPGAMSLAATAMFQTVGCIRIANKVKPNPSNPKEMLRISERHYLTSGDGVRVLGDRTKLFPAEAPLNFLQIWEENFVPYFATRGV